MTTENQIMHFLNQKKMQASRPAFSFNRQPNHENK